MPSQSPKLYLATQERNLYVYEVSTRLLSGISHNEHLFRLLTHHETAEPIVHMLPFVHHQAKGVTYSLICCEEYAFIEIYDMDCT